MEPLEVVGLIIGGGGASFAGAFAAIKVHIAYLTKHNADQDRRIDRLESVVLFGAKKREVVREAIQN